MILLISYDLNGHERPEAYEAVKDMIISNAISWKKPLFSQWLVETEDDSDVWHSRMKNVADDGDYWFICRVGSERQGWLKTTVWDWIRSNE